MVIWGTFWGAAFGLVWAGHVSQVHILVGALAGAMAGLSLRYVVRNEIAAASKPVLLVPDLPSPDDAEGPPTQPTPMGRGEAEPLPSWLQQKESRPAAMPLTLLGFAAAFVVPAFVFSTDGNPVVLFGCYLLLSVAGGAVAWATGWGVLNLVGFLATFGVAAAWGAIAYRPQHFASVWPFLAAFFLVYLVAGLSHAVRHARSPRQPVDTTLVVGTPIVSFGLQAVLVRDLHHAVAFSSLTLGALYLALGWWLVQRRAGVSSVNRWLAQCTVVLGLVFVVLAVPLAVAGR